MFKKLSHYLFVVASLFLLSTSIQVVAADKAEEMTSSSIQVSEKISINKASNEQLSIIIGIGTQKTQAIIEYREVNGDFVSIEELVKVKGIGANTLQKISPFVSL